MTDCLGGDPSTDPAFADQLDDEDPLSWVRERFYADELEDECYLDGNSLGLLSKDAERAVERVVAEWRDLAIRGWRDANPPWFWYGERLGGRLAPLVGARKDEVVVGNSTTVNVHTLVGTFLDADATAGDKVAVVDLDFPTDRYAVGAQLRQRGLEPDEHLVVVESRDGRTVEEADIVAALDDPEVGMLFSSAVLFKSGQLLDVERLTRAAHERDALAGFDLSHAVGVVPHELSEVGVDFAAWCHYKYLNAGPGAIAGLYVNERHHGIEPALAGWWGHEKETQFEMRSEFTPASTAGAWQIGTVPVLSAAPLDGSLDLAREAGIDAIRERSVRLTEYLLFLADELLGDAFEIGSPREPTRRGGHVALEHPEADCLDRALAERGVAVDSRPPNVIRVCPSPYYTRYREVREAVEHLREIDADLEPEQ